MVDDYPADRFLVPGVCKTSPVCEIKLELESKEILFACKHRLAAVSETFLGMLFGQGTFLETGKDVITIGEISKRDLLLFLRATDSYESTDPFRIPKDGDLCTLITLADRFLSDILKGRLVTMLEDDQLQNVSSDRKKNILITAWAHRVGCPTILDAALRLCATLDFQQLRSLLDSVPVGVLLAVTNLRSQLQPPVTLRLRHLQHVPIDTDLLNIT